MCDRTKRIGYKVIGFYSYGPYSVIDKLGRIPFPEQCRAKIVKNIVRCTHDHWFTLKTFICGWTSKILAKSSKTGGGGILKMLVDQIGPKKEAGANRIMLNNP
jgi:hypothetical protein